MSTEDPDQTPFDVTVGDHRFRRTESGTVGHYIAGAPDHSANGLTTTIEAFALEIMRLRERVRSLGGDEPG